MPLEKGNSRAVIGRNIQEMQNSGHPHAQAVAAALHTADQSSHLAKGGLAAPHPEKDQFHGGGLFRADTPGRTDRLPRSVPADSFVVPAAEVASLGEGNTEAGGKMLEHILSGITSAPEKRADGGASGDKSAVIVAGGEYLIPRDKIVEIGRRLRAAGKSKARSDLAAGHQWCRDLVLRLRKQELKRLKSAPLPKK